MLIFRNKIKKNYLDGWLYDIFLGTALKKMRKYVASSINEFRLFPVLDLCCGTGAQCRFIKKGNAVGVDIDRNVLDYAKSRAPYASFICGDGADLPFKNNKFQSIVISYALHEKSVAVRGKMIREAKRMLKKNGKLLIIDYEIPIDFPSRLGRMVTYFIERLAGEEHFRNGQQFLKQGGLKRFLKEQEIKVTKNRWLKLGSSRLIIGEFETNNVDYFR
jgi:demethylmenaquinone methyltransferase/2-methoxy-6-polyprenyl-1,4-benzoquinol methylase